MISSWAGLRNCVPQLRISSISLFTNERFNHQMYKNNCKVICRSREQRRCEFNLKFKNVSQRFVNVVSTSNKIYQSPWVKRGSWESDCFGFSVCCCDRPTLGQGKTTFAYVCRLLKDLLPCSSTIHGLPCLIAYERLYLMFKNPGVCFYIYKRAMNNIS